MKVLKWIKWIFSFLVLVIALGVIVWGTNYTLHNKGIRNEVKEKVYKTIEKATSNESKTNLSEIYNIYLNEEKHKIKIEYQLITRSDESKVVSMYVYFDGKNSLERDVIVTQNINTIHEAFLLENVGSKIRVSESSFRILKDGDIDYLLVNVGMVQDSLQEYYYILDNDGDLINDKGILVFDSSKDYLDINGVSFNNYYDNENKTLAKIENNNIYALEEKVEKKKLSLIEYKYYFDEGKLKKEKVVTFEDIILNDNKTVKE